MRALPAFLLLTACATGPHAETFAKRNFGFAGPREITLVGPRDDTHALRLLLQREGFSVLEVAELEQASTPYVATVGGVCNNPLVYAPPDADLHVHVVKVSNGERVLSVRLSNKSECPDAFFREAAAAVARYWPQTTVSATR